MYRLTRPVAAMLVLAVLALACYPLVADSFYLRLVTKILGLAIFAMSLDLLVGFTGLVSLGHAAFFGVGGYVAGVLVNRAGITDLPTLMAAAMLGAAFAAMLIGWVSIRTGGIYFIMITLAFGQMAYFFFHDVRFWGGADGLNIAAKPRLVLFGHVLLDMKDRVHAYGLGLALVVAVFLFLVVLLRSPFGQVVQGIRANEGRMRSLGYDVQRYKLVAFVIAGALAGLAGFIEAGRASFITPNHVGWQESGLALVIVLLGGMGTLFGPVVGAFILVLLEDFVSGMTERWLLVMGLFVIAIVLFLPNGVAGLRLRRRAPP